MLNKVKTLPGISLVVYALFAVYPFIALAYSPFVTTGSATGITSYSATLNGSVNADNMPTSVWFEYSTDNNLRGSASATAYRFASGNSGNIIANISGLYSNTIYYFRAVAQNVDGRAYGNIYTFTTNYNYPFINNSASAINGYDSDNFSSTPSVVTNPATAVLSHSAKLNSLIINAGNDSKTWFEWSTSPSLNEITPVISLGSLSSAKHVGTITGLLSGTTYYFRAVVQNGSERTEGAILSFTTNNVSPAVSIAEKSMDKTQTGDAGTDAVQSTDSLLPANVLGSESFLPVNIFGWIILIILVLILLVVSKHLYRSFLEKKTPPASGHA